MNNAEAIGTIYDEREEFIIIGLTGRTGSGCTTVAEILKATPHNPPIKKRSHGKSHITA